MQIFTRRAANADGESQAVANHLGTTVAALQAAGWFALYVCWLTAFAMAGPLLRSSISMGWFVGFHALGLLGLARWANGRVFRKLLPVGLVLTAVSTTAFGLLHTQAAAWALGLAGLAAAPLSVALGMVLKASGQPVWAGALGLIGGNLASVVLTSMTWPATARLTLLACALLALWQAVRVPAELADGADYQGRVSGLWSYLPCIFLFQTVSGMMYGQLLPGYRQAGWLPGLELLFYILAVGGLAVAMRRTESLARPAILVAVILSILAFSSCYALDQSWGVNLGLFAMMAAAGLFDLFVLSQVLSHQNQLKAYGYGVGVMVAGIAVGEGLVASMGGSLTKVSFMALVLLNLSVMALFMPGCGKKVATAAASAQPLEVSPPPLVADAGAQALDAPPLLKKVLLEGKLSHQELRVLAAVQQYPTYREVAQALGISESSVKTYMQRIYRKTGAFNWQQLKQFL